MTSILPEIKCYYVNVAKTKRIYSPFHYSLLYTVYCTEKWKGKIKLAVHGLYILPLRELRGLGEDNLIEFSVLNLALLPDPDLDSV